MLIAVARDLIVQRRVHIVYRVGVPLIVAGQLLAVTLADVSPAFWVNLSRSLVGVG